MPRFSRYTALAALAFAAAPGMLFGQKSDPCAPPAGYERTTNNISNVSDETTKASTTVLSDSSNLTETKQATTAGSPGSGPAAPAAAAAKATVQDEGDGKYVVHTMPGQTDAKELTILPNTKNMYIEESTGDKYLITPDGSVTRIPHKAAATQKIS